MIWGTVEHMYHDAIYVCQVKNKYAWEWNICIWVQIMDNQVGCVATCQTWSWTTPTECNIWNYSGIQGTKTLTSSSSGNDRSLDDRVMSLFPLKYTSVSFVTFLTGWPSTRPLVSSFEIVVDPALSESMSSITTSTMLPSAWHEMCVWVSSSLSVQVLISLTPPLSLTAVFGLVTCKSSCRISSSSASHVVTDLCGRLMVMTLTGMRSLVVGLLSTDSVSNGIAGGFTTGNDGCKNDPAWLALDRFGNPRPPLTCIKV